jgi:hypothetical protein
MITMVRKLDRGHLTVGVTEYKISLALKWGLIYPSLSALTFSALLLLLLAVAYVTPEYCSSALIHGQTGASHPLCRGRRANRA